MTVLRQSKNTDCKAECTDSVLQHIKNGQHPWALTCVTMTLTHSDAYSKLCFYVEMEKKVRKLLPPHNTLWLIRKLQCFDVITNKAVTFLVTIFTFVWNKLLEFGKICKFNQPRAENFDCNNRAPFLILEVLLRRT